MKTIKKNPNGKPKLKWGLEKLRGPHGGPRPGSGRPPKPDRDKWGQVTCVLRHDTIDRLREAATPPDAPLTKYFGEYLQWHLDQYPPLDWATWQAFLAVAPRRVTQAIVRGSAKKRLNPAERAALKELKDALYREPQSLAEEVAQERHRRTFVQPLEAKKK
jgi:hypothetical protein